MRNERSRLETILLKFATSIAVLSTAVFLAPACAHEAAMPEEVVAVPTEATPAPQPKPRTKIVYVKTPETESAMTMPPPYEPAAAEPRDLVKDVVHIFWPLLTLLAAGFLMIVGLFIEHLILNKQLERRRVLKASL